MIAMNQYSAAKMVDEVVGCDGRFVEIWFPALCACG